MGSLNDVWIEAVEAGEEEEFLEAIKQEGEK